MIITKCNVSGNVFSFLFPYGTDMFELYQHVLQSYIIAV